MSSPDKFTIAIFEDKSGKYPYDLWLEELDQKTAARIEARISRFKSGNFGDHKSVGESVWEARLFFGPGYRVYFAKEAGFIVLLLCGGDKSTQNRDIKEAQNYLKEWRRENG